MLGFGSQSGRHAYRMIDAAKRLGAAVEETARAIRLIKNGVNVFAKIIDFQDIGPSLEFRALPVPPGLPRFHIYPEGFKSFASKIFGGQDIDTGIAAFDIQYMIKGDDPSLVTEVLTPERCGAMLATFRDGQLTSRRDLVTLRMDAYYTSAGVTDEMLDAGFKLLFDLGSADAYRNAVLRDLPDATYRLAPLPYVDIQGPGEIRIGFARHRKELCSEARAVIPDLPELPERVVERVRSMNASIQQKDDQVVIRWPAVVRDPQPFVAAIELLRSLVTGPSEGVFR